MESTWRKRRTFFCDAKALHVITEHRERGFKRLVEVRRARVLWWRDVLCGGKQCGGHGEVVVEARVKQKVCVLRRPEQHHGLLARGHDAVEKPNACSVELVWEQIVQVPWASVTSRSTHRDALDTVDLVCVRVFVCVCVCV